MIRAGKLDREIIIKRASVALNSTGTPVSTWATVVTLRAQLIDDVTEEKQRDHGESTERTVTFQTRYFCPLFVSDQIFYQGHDYNITNVKEIGRRRGLELRAVRVGP